MIICLAKSKGKHQHILQSDAIYVVCCTFLAPPNQFHNPHINRFNPATILPPADGIDQYLATSTSLPPDQSPETEFPTSILPPTVHIPSVHAARDARCRTTAIPSPDKRSDVIESLDSCLSAGLKERSREKNIQSGQKKREARVGRRKIAHRRRRIRRPSFPASSPTGRSIEGVGEAERERERWGWAWGFFRSASAKKGKVPRAPFFCLSFTEKWNAISFTAGADNLHLIRNQPLGMDVTCIKIENLACESDSEGIIFDCRYTLR